MYRWTEPIEPDGVPRRHEPPTDGRTAWLTDRPEPRSSYLFGDEPEQPGPDRVDSPTGAWHADASDPPRRNAPTWYPPTEQAGRHRQRRRFPRPLAVGGAAAAATLVVSLGASALMLPRGDEPISADGAIAAASAAPGTTGAAPDGALAAPSPSSLPPSPTRTAAPKPTRTAAPSRNLQRSTGTTSNGITAELQQVVNLVNKERARAGCKALIIDDKLMLAAQRHSQDQANHKTMSHDGSDGSDVGDRLDRVGYAWRAYGENVAWNQQSPAAVMDAWMNSAGHRANILNCSFTEIGVGVARSNGPYWTQDFGTPR